MTLKVHPKNLQYSLVVWFYLNIDYQINKKTTALVKLLILLDPDNLATVYLSYLSNCMNSVQEKVVLLLMPWLNTTNSRQTKMGMSVSRQSRTLSVQQGKPSIPGQQAGLSVQTQRLAECTGIGHPIQPSTKRYEKFNLIQMSEFISQIQSCCNGIVINEHF